MNTINGSGMHVPVRELAVGGDQPKHMTGLNGFGEYVQEASTPHTTDDQCHGAVNQVDLDAFFAAWGSDDARFDIDNNGIVDGSDLAIFLSAPANPEAGSVDDIHAQWGFQGESTADLNGDFIVDGQDLAIALGGNATEPQTEDTEQTQHFAGNKLEALLEDWGTDATRSDFNNDGIVNGLDLSILLSGRNSGNWGSSSSQSVTLPADMATLIPIDSVVETGSQVQFDPTKPKFNDFARNIFNQLSEMGFSKLPPQNLNELIDAFNLSPKVSKSVLSKIVDLFGGQDGGSVAQG